MELQDVLTQLVLFVEEAAPAVWAIAMKQVMVRTIKRIVWTILSAIAVPFLWKLAKHQRELHDDEFDLYDAGYVLSLIAMAVCIILGIANGLAIIGYLLNPEYYAIELLLQYAQ